MKVLWDKSGGSYLFEDFIMDHGGEHELNVCAELNREELDDDGNDPAELRAAEDKYASHFASCRG